MTKIIIPLTTRCPISLCGGKAFYLSQLQQWGLSIPSGFCLTTRAQRLAFQNDGITDYVDRLKLEMKNTKSIDQILLRQIRERILMLRIHVKLQKNLTHHLEILGSEKVAVRSSALVEDNPSNSFAGLFETVLNVNNKIEEVWKAIKQVWASFFAIEIFDYILRNGFIDFPMEMGVIVQRMISSEEKGVAFSLDPLTHNRRVIYIEKAIASAGELVDGEVTPERYVFDKLELNVNEETKSIVQHLAVSISHIEKKSGIPVDVEWVMVNNRFYFLQMRPITTPHEKKTILWTDENVGEVLPEPVTPLTWSILGNFTNNGFKRAVARLGIRYSGNLFKLINGKAYFNHSHFSEIFTEIFPPHVACSGSFLLQFFRKSKINSVYLLRIFRLLWYSIRLPRQSKIVENRIIQFIHRHDQNDKNKVNLSVNLQKILNMQEYALNIHIANTLIGEILYQVLRVFFSRQPHGNGEGELLRLFKRINNLRSVLSSQELLFLARQINSILKQKNMVPLNYNHFHQMMESDTQLLALFNCFLMRFGYRSEQEFELAYPRWAENRQQVLEMLYHIIKQLPPKNMIPKEHGNNTNHFSSEINIHPRWTRLIIMKLINQLKIISFHRENVKARIVELHFHLKQCLLASAQELRSHKIFNNVDLIYFLTIQEILDGLTPEKKLKLYFDHRVLTERKKKYIHFKKMKHPDQYLQLGEKFVPIHQTQERERNILKGIATSPGIVRGKARVVNNEKSEKNFQKGEILVTHSINPSWLPVFFLAKGIITEIGGALSHGAIMARELGVPMIVAVKNACQLIRNGDELKMNGLSGIIHLKQNLSAEKIHEQKGIISSK